VTEFAPADEAAARDGCDVIAKICEAAIGAREHALGRG
jgi:hypothetical protein